jgi:NitT/TauT family transport system substrate-binding protein
MFHVTRVLFAATIAGSFAVSPAVAADKLKIAVGQREIWHGAPAALGERAGIFRKHDLDLELLFTSGSGETMQATIAGSVDVGVAAGTFGVMGAYAKGAPIRIIGAESTGEDSYWYVRADSPVKSMADMKGRTMSYSTNGSSTHANALGFVELYKVDAKLVATGGFPATFTMVMSGQIDAGWSAPPYAMDALRKGEIRVIARSSELPLVKGHTIRVLIANKPSLDDKPEALSSLHARLSRDRGLDVCQRRGAENLRGVCEDQHRGRAAGARGVRSQGDGDSGPGVGTRRPHARCSQVQVPRPAADAEPARGPGADSEIARLSDRRIGARGGTSRSIGVLSPQDRS